MQICSRHNFWDVGWIMEWSHIIWMHILGAPDAGLRRAIAETAIVWNQPTGNCFRDERNAWKHNEQSVLGWWETEHNFPLFSSFLFHTLRDWEIVFAMKGANENKTSRVCWDDENRAQLAPPSFFQLHTLRDWSRDEQMVATSVIWV